MKFFVAILSIVISGSGYLLLKKDPVIHAATQTGESSAESERVVAQVVAVAHFMGQNEAFQKQVRQKTQANNNNNSSPGESPIDSSRGEKIQQVYAQMRTLIGQGDQASLDQLRKLLDENPEDVESFFRSYFVSGAMNEGPGRYRMSLDTLFSVAEMSHEPEYLDLIHTEIVRNFNSPGNEWYRRYQSMETRPGQVDLLVEQARMRAATSALNPMMNRLPANDVPEQTTEKTSGSSSGD